MFETIIDTINTFLYSKLLIVILIGSGIYFTIRTRFPHVRLFRKACNAVMGKPEGKESVSSFQALMVSTASRVGTGNIVGVSSAICIGGVGSVFWMWIIAILGSASALAESTLAQIYKQKGEDGKCYGGPAYYIEAALHSRGLAVVFCIAMILSYAFGFNMLASYNLQSTFAGQPFYNADITPWIIGGILALVMGWCLLGGGNRIVKVTSTLVPFMGIAYILVSLLVVVLNIGQLPSVMAQIFKEAFDFKAIFAGFAGSAMMQGIRRGLSSNEAGMGSTPHAHATADVKHPGDQGIIATMGVFIDTSVILTLTALVILSTGALSSGETASALAQVAFDSAFGSFGTVFIAICMLFFAFTTIIGWYYFGEVNVRSLFGKKAVKVYAALVVVFVLVGSTLKVDLVWNMSDMFNGLMVIPNLIAILASIPIVRKLSREHEGFLKK